MKVTFANDFIGQKCRVIAAMAPGLWHSRGHLYAGIVGGDLMPHLVKNGFLERRKNAEFSEWFYEYRLTQRGVVLNAQLKAIGI